MRREIGSLRSAALLLLLVGLLTGGPAHAQNRTGDLPAASAGQVESLAAPADVAESAVAQSSTTLAEGSVRTESMRDYWHVFIAYGSAWLLLFGYVLTLGRRFGQLEDEVRRLRGTS